MQKEESVPPWIHANVNAFNSACCAPSYDAIIAYGWFKLLAVLFRTKSGEITHLTNFRFRYAKIRFKVSCVLEDQLAHFKALRRFNCW